MSERKWTIAEIERAYADADDSRQAMKGDNQMRWSFLSYYLYKCLNAQPEPAAEEFYEKAVAEACDASGFDGVYDEGRGYDEPAAFEAGARWMWERMKKNV